MQPEMAPTAFPPPIFEGPASVSWFSSFRATSSENASGGGGLNIVFFGQTR
jgi:hypothetical protein